jgi:hypothetical protein
MPQGSNSQVNIGIRRMITSLATPQYRNFEVNGTQTYAVMASTYSYAGTVYTVGQTIPYDAAVATKYSDPATLERDFNAGVLNPSS